MQDARLGAIFRAVRIRRGWRQIDVATRARVSRAEVSLIEQAGHMVPYEQPEAFVNAVTRFLG